MRKYCMSNSDPIQTLFEGNHIRLVKQGRWEYAQRKNASGIVAIVAVTADKKIILVEQYRVPVQAAVIEFPAGLSGDIAGEEDETLETAAIRELEEETGYKAQRMEKLISGPVSSGSSSSQLTLFRAHDIVKTGEGGGDDTENITVHEIALDQVEAWLTQQAASGKQVDPKVFAGFYYIRNEMPK